MQKHPHLRGENLTKRRLSVEHLETSPPTWGKPSVNVEQVLIGGNIPTYVGKTRFTNFESVIAMETSPPTWGKPRRRDRERPRPGNIPTYVGKTERTNKAVRTRRKHPHLRGENRRARRASARASETSPPTWGKRKNCRRSHEVHGNIPTYVGKTGGGIVRSPSRWKHPHLRGENQAQTYDDGEVPETSPPTWGKRQEAYRTLSRGQKHPHLRGENFGFVENTDFCSETSPPTWGKPRRR